MAGLRICLLLALTACLVLSKPSPVKRTTLQELCNKWCQNGMCPPGCSQADVIDWNKRSLDQFDDLSFDDYIFLKLIGRNLNEGRLNV